MLSGIQLITAGGAYLDPWHDFAGVAGVIRPVLELRDATTVRDDVEAALAGLPGSRPRLVVVNIGNGAAGEASALVRRGIEEYLDLGGRMLALHSTATAFPAWDGWEAVLGGRWVRGTTFHPDYGPGEIDVDPGLGLAAFDTTDEFYTDLRVAADVRVLASHVDITGRHPLAWLHSAGRVVYDALGHDVASFSNAGRLALLDAELDLLLESP